MGRESRLWLAAVVLALGCTEVMYPGPRRPAPEVAVLVSSETSIDVLDGVGFFHMHSQEGARYEVLPGRHQLGVTLFVVTYQPEYADVQRSSKLANVCLDAQAGHNYVVGREGSGNTWHPTIVDQTTGAPVPSLRCAPN